MVPIKVIFTCRLNDGTLRTPTIPLGKGKRKKKKKKWDLIVWNKLVS